MGCKGGYFINFTKFWKKSIFYVSAPKGLKYYDVHYLRQHTIWILKEETKTIQMRPNLAGYTTGSGCWKILGLRCYGKHPKMPIFMTLITPKTPSELQNYFDIIYYIHIKGISNQLTQKWGVKVISSISQNFQKSGYFYVSAHKGLKYYDVHYLRHHTIRILKVETKTIQMRPNLAGYTSGGVGRKFSARATSL